MRRISDLFDILGREGDALTPSFVASAITIGRSQAVSIVPALTIIVAGNGSDTLEGDGGILAYFASDGADRITFKGDGAQSTLGVGGGGDDRLTGVLNSFLVGGAGEDVLTLTEGGAAWGGESAIVLSAFWSAIGVGLPPAGGAAGSLSLVAERPEAVYFYLNQHIDDGVRDIIKGSAMGDDLAIGRLDSVDGGLGFDRAFAVFDAFTKGVSIDFTDKEISSTLATALSATISGVRPSSSRERATRTPSCPTATWNSSWAVAAMTSCRWRSGQSCAATAGAATTG